MTEALGEIIAADSQVLEVECHQLYEAPAFGSFVRADCPTGISQYAVVFGMATGPFDCSRVVQAHRMAPGELEQRKPHLTTLLRTTFQARVVGYGNEGGQVSGTPPRPARLHCFVYAAGTEEVRALTASPAFLRPVAQVRDAPVEDLLVSVIQAARRAWGAGAPVVAWGKYLARLLRQDYVTLEGVLQRLGPAPGVPAAPPPAAAPGETHTGRPGAPRWEDPLPLTSYRPPDGRDPFAD